MPSHIPQMVLLALLLSTGWTFGEDVQITVFTLKDGTKLEALSYASAMQKGEGVYSVTTTSGEKRVIWSTEVQGKTSLQMPLEELPDFARQKMETQRKAGQEWIARAEAAKKEEEEKRKAAYVQAAATAEEANAFRSAAVDEQSARQRCAMLWDAHQSALKRIGSAQNAIARAEANYSAALDDIRSMDRWRPDTPEEAALWRTRRYRAEQRRAAAEDQARGAERDLAVATDEANQHASQLAHAKAELEKAQTKLAEAKQRYEEARERLKRIPAPKSDPAREEIRPVQQPAANNAPETAILKSTVVRSIEKGEFVQLADGSMWEIHPEDRLETTRWRPEQAITIVGGSDPTFTNRLVNGVTHGAARAKRLK